MWQTPPLTARPPTSTCLQPFSCDDPPRRRRRCVASCRRWQTYKEAAVHSCAILQQTGVSTVVRIRCTDSRRSSPSASYSQAIDNMKTSISHSMATSVLVIVCFALFGSFCSSEASQDDASASSSSSTLSSSSHAVLGVETDSPMIDRQMLLRHLTRVGSIDSHMKSVSQ
jgi:hypothetical protein